MSFQDEEQEFDFSFVFGDSAGVHEAEAGERLRCSSLLSRDRYMFFKDDVAVWNQMKRTKRI